MGSRPRPASDMIRAARIFYAAELLGGVLYRRLAEAVGNPDVQQALQGFGSDEYRHADWYLEWLLERGLAPPRLESMAARVAPALARVLGARSLEERLRLFSSGEGAAARHLRTLVIRIHDPSLRAIVERTIPAEQGHSDWFPERGHRMLAPTDRLTRSWFDLFRNAPRTPR
jgi:rubrerythrin